MRALILLIFSFLIVAALETRGPIAVVTPVPQPTPQVICVGILGDSVQITQLSAGRRSGDRTSIDMTIANVSARDLNGVSWGITSDDGQANTSTVNIPRCGAVTVSLAWPTLPGSHTFTGDVDPTNTFGESAAGFANNHRTFMYSPLQVATLIETQDLDYDKARDASAMFLDNVNTPVSACTRIGQENARTSPNYGAGQPGVVFVADSPSVASFIGIQVGTGCTADPEAFKDFRLKNGWKIKSVSLKFTTNRENQADMHDSLTEAQSADERQRQLEGFVPTIIPTSGSDDPHIKVHVSVKPAAFLKVYARITIVGPAGLDPYGGTPSSCGVGFVPVTTASGPGCAKANDVESCGSAAPGPSGVFRCAQNNDCASGFICPTNVCANRCVRGHAP